MLRALLLVVVLCVTPLTVVALEPTEVAVVANRFVEQSVELASYYMQQRGIPVENLIKIDTVATERCSRIEYNENIATPIRAALAQKTHIRALVTMYGVPLKVSAPALTSSAKKQVSLLQKSKKNASEKLRNTPQEQSATIHELQETIKSLQQQLDNLRKKNYSSALDSEIALVLAGDYPLKMWVANPFYVGASRQPSPITKDNVLLVSRLDGPSAEIVKRIINDSLYAEKNGLTGTAYFDARWPQPPSHKQLSGYALYDNSIHKAAAQLKKGALMPIVVDARQRLFQPGEAPHAALYCGWYKLGHYVDAFDWQRGAVGYHIASSECATLRAGSSQVWCKRMLEDGVAATLGPVDEPYVQAFPLPEVFFHFLTDGYYTLGEAYFLSLPYLSWRMVLIGDPLYRPFKARSLSAMLNSPINSVIKVVEEY